MNQQIQLRGKNVAVEKLTKQERKSGELFTMTDTNEFFGKIIFVGEAAAKDLVVGQKVYFGTQYHQATIANKKLCVMEDINVLAVINEEPETAKA